MTDLLRNRPGTTQAMMAVFDDAATLAHALAFEVELAHAQAANGVIRSDAAEGIARACRQSIH